MKELKAQLKAGVGRENNNVFIVFDLHLSAAAAALAVQAKDLKAQLKSGGGAALFRNVCFLNSSLATSLAAALATFSLLPHSPGGAGEGPRSAAQVGRRHRAIGAAAA